MCKTALFYVVFMPLYVPLISYDMKVNRDVFTPSASEVQNK